MSDNRSEFGACLNSHGLYNSTQFVLRLSPEVHRIVASLPQGIVTGGIDAAGLRAFSTYFHETLHWWQHIGSTSGLMLSLSYPEQAHVNYSHLRRLIPLIGPKKSILRWVEAAAPRGGGPDTQLGLANIVVNNHFDIEYSRALIVDARLDSRIGDTRLFDSAGHSYSIAYANILLLLRETIGHAGNPIPHPKEWEEEFSRLRVSRHRGFYQGSEIRRPPVGARQIFEGQARFAQLQYLYFASGGNLTWTDVRREGLLSGVYSLAFDIFLELAEVEFPPSIGHPTVALFLLVCDLAINPGARFPLNLRVIETFIEDVDPGIRFVFLCRAVTRQPQVKTAVTEYSRGEYELISETLSSLLLIDSPLAIAGAVSKWARDSEAVKGLMVEHSTSRYSPANLPVRLLLAQFIEFSKDKLAKPEFFCWPGAWMAGPRTSPESIGLFERHAAAFVDKGESGGVYPRLRDGRDRSAIHDAFSSFYAFSVTYDLARQWVAQPGPFAYDYRWLADGSEADFKAYGGRHFEMVYGVHPDQFEIL